MTSSSVREAQNFEVGMRVRCIDDSAGAGYEWAKGERLVRGRYYTVIATFIDEDGMGVLRLQEIERAKRSQEIWGENIGYYARRFEADNVH